MNSLAIVVTYNRISLLKQCIDHLTNQEIPCDILIVDNASTDGTSQYIDGLTDIMCLHLEQNTGGAGGFNAGIRWGAEHGYKYLWVMDDDTLPMSNALKVLLNAAETLNDCFGFLASTPLWIDGTPCRMNAHHPIKGQDASSSILRIE